MYKFDLSNVECRYIKNLLLNTYLPPFPVAHIGDFIVGGSHYVYEDTVIKCLTSGILFDDGPNLYEGMVYVPRRDALGRFEGVYSVTCNEILLCSPDILCGMGIRPATYSVVAQFYTHKQTPGVTSNYLSTSEEYDGETHRQLGKYLRWYKGVYNIDLMPLYNCFTRVETNKIHLTPSGIEDGDNPEVITWIVPAQVNKTYQIYLNSVGNVIVKGVYLNEFGRIFKDVTKESGYIDELLNESVINVASVTYKTPITYKSFTTNSKLVDFSNNFYIAIQVHKDHSGSIAVLESDTISTNKITRTSGEIFLNRKDGNWPNVRYEWFSPAVKSSLTTIATSNSIPYSDRLLEYLLGNTIDPQEDISKNIYRVQEKLNIADKPYIDKDAWSPVIRPMLYRRYFDSSTSRASYKVKEDILGFYDKDIENTLYGYEGV